MTSETDHPRQRTVAELLAEHGDAGPTGRRRRRREADGPDPAVTAAGPVAATGSIAPAWPSGASPAPDRAILREPVPRDAPPLPRRESRPWDRRPAEAELWPVQPRETPSRQALAPPPRSLAPPPRVEPGRAARAGAAALLGHRAPPDPVRDEPTEKMPRIGDAGPGVLDPGLTEPIEYVQPTAPAAPEAGEPAVGAPTDGDGADTVAAAAVVPATSERRTRASRRAAEVDPGPPTQAGRPPSDFDAFDDHPAGLGAGGEVDGPGDGDAAGVDTTARRRLGRTAPGPSTGQAWMAVVAQWIIGAVGGAALWVGFRYLWHDLPVVALAAAVLITVGLVLVVRSLLRNNDLRTTVFAVLVGLLLTVSPALLVLLGR